MAMKPIVKMADDAARQKLALQPNGTFAPSAQQKPNLPMIAPIRGVMPPPPKTGGMIATPPPPLTNTPPPPMGSTPPPIYQPKPVGVKSSIPGVYLKKGGKVKSTSSASSRGDGIAQRGKTKGRIV
jgi:hypothetical protein